MHSLAVHSAQLLLDTPQHRLSFLAAEQKKHRKEFGHLGTLHYRKKLESRNWSRYKINDHGSRNVKISKEIAEFVRVPGPGS